MLKPSLNRYNTQVHSDVCQEKSTLQSKLELSRCARIIILSLTQGHTTTNQLCWFCDTMWNQTIDYFKHAHSDACSQWIQTASSNKQSPVRAKICHCDHGAESSITKNHSRLLRKLRHTLTLMVWWNRSSLTSTQGQTQTRQNKLHQKLETMTSIWIQAWSKAAQNKTSSAGLARATIHWCFFIFPNPLSILVHDEQTSKPHSKDNLKWLEGLFRKGQVE